MKEVLLITVNYKNSRVTQALASSLENCDSNDKLKMVILDNESNNNSVNELDRIQSQSSIPIQIISSEKNLYYWGGAAFVLDSLKLDYNKDPHWIIVCNNDIRIEQRDFFTQLLSMDPMRYPVIAPGIKSGGSGKMLNPFLVTPISKVMDLYYRLYYWSPFTAGAVHLFGRFFRILYQLLKKDKIASSGGQIYAPHGSFIIFSRYFFRSGGYLDKGFRFFGEEISTAEIAKRLGLPIYYVPELQVIHDEHQSLNKTPWMTAFYHSKQSYLYLKQKFRTV